MIRVLIVDDEPPARRKVRRFLARDAEIGEIREVASAREAIEVLGSFAPDLMFLDVQMPDDDGFSVLSAVTEPRDFDVIFLTAHAHYAVEAFDTEALDYLLKPVDPVRFERALDRAKARIVARREQTPEPAPAPLQRIVVVTEGREIFLSVTRIDWAGADGNYVRLYSGSDTYTVRATLDALARRLDPDRFVQVNRGELVNLDYVREMRPLPHGERLVVLKDGAELIWTRRFRPAGAASSRLKAHSSR
jgi:two-component system, LytTR family, response regulator